MLRALHILFLSCAYAIAAEEQPPKPADIKAKIEQASKLGASSNDAFSKGHEDEGKNFAEQSTKLIAEARNDYESIHAAESEDPTLLRDYADLLMQMDDADLAEQALLHAVAIDPEDATLWLKLGQAQAALGPQKETYAIRSLRKAAVIEPKSDATPKALASLGALYQEAGLYDFAKEAYAKALELDPNHVGSKLSMASLDARDGKMIEAKAIYDAIGTNAVAYGPFIKQTLSKAIADFVQSRRWLPDTAESHLAYAELLVRIDRLSDSYLPLNRSLMLDDKNYVAWNLMGSVLRAMDQPKAARDAFAKSLALNGDQPRTTEAIAELDKIIGERAARDTSANSATQIQQPVSAGGNLSAPPPAPNASEAAVPRS